MVTPSNTGNSGNRSGLSSIPPGSRQIPAQFLNAIGRAIDQARIVPGNGLAHFETPGGTYLEQTDNGREFIHPFYIQYLGQVPGYPHKALVSIAEGRVMGRADGERGAWEKEDIRESIGIPYQTSLGIYGTWGLDAVQDNGIPVEDRATDDLSIIKSGEGITPGPAGKILSPYLVQSNMGSYEITTSEEWRLICIKAVGNDSDESPKGWRFEMVNLSMDDIDKIFNKPNAAEYDPPRIVDNAYYTVRGDTAKMPQGINLAEGDVPNHPEQLDEWQESIAPPITLDGPFLIDPSDNTPKKLTLVYQWRYHLHRIVEVGTYILPIAYHRETAQGLEIQQVARSDFHFFPVPRIHIWSKTAVPLSIGFADSPTPDP